MLARNPINSTTHCVPTRISATWKRPLARTNASRVQLHLHFDFSRIVVCLSLPLSLCLFFSFYPLLCYFLSRERQKLNMLIVSAARRTREKYSRAISKLTPGTYHCTNILCTRVQRLGRGRNKLGVTSDLYFASPYTPNAIDSADIHNLEANCISFRPHKHFIAFLPTFISRDGIKTRRR